ncbi:MAG: HAMP domain-containing sensor histidine kinase [Candidatus Acidiferrum sp.]
MQEAASQLNINTKRPSSSRKRTLVALAIFLPVLLAAASLRGRPSYALTAFGDLTQLFLLATATIFFAWRGISNRGAQRAFWLLLALGFAMWSVNMFLWAYYEVWFNRSVPSVPIGEFLLFTKLVPMLAALALEPNHDKPDRSRLLGLFDLTSLLVYWTYVYLFWSMAYLLAGNDLATYNSHSDILDALGNLVFLFAVVAVAFRSRWPWRRFYLNFLGAAATYSLASLAINWAIESGRYYTGSVYDVPLTAAMAWFCVDSITFTPDSRSLQAQTSGVGKTEAPPKTKPVLWPARLSMLVTLSTPAIGLWLAMSGETQDPVRHFRILLTLITMLFLTILLLLKQDLLNAKLSGFLLDASLAYSNLKRFEDQLVQSEKLASLGELVARVAHEINRAMLAVARDVERLDSHPVVDSNRRKMSAKIGEAARRTNNLVESMLSFAQEMPVNRSNVNVRSLLETAVNLTRSERRHRVRVEIQELGGVPLVEGDANQLIQVFVQIIENAIDAMEATESGLLTIAIRAEQERIEIRFTDTGSGLQDPRRVFEPFYTTKAIGKGVGLGLSTCYGIIRQHGGEIACQNRPQGGAVFSLIIPVVVIHSGEAVF